MSDLNKRKLSASSFTPGGPQINLRSSRTSIPFLSVQFNPDNSEMFTVKEQRSIMEGTKEDLIASRLNRDSITYIDD